MWLLGSLLTAIGLGLVGYGATSSANEEHAAGTWAVGRGAVFLAAGTACFQTWMFLHAQAHAALAVHEGSILAITSALLAGLLVCRFSEDRELVLALPQGPEPWLTRPASPRHAPLRVRRIDEALHEARP